MGWTARLQLWDDCEGEEYCGMREVKWEFMSVGCKVALGGAGGQELSKAGGCVSYLAAGSIHFFVVQVLTFVFQSCCAQVPRSWSTRVAAGGARASSLGMYYLGHLVVCRKWQ